MGRAMVAATALMALAVLPLGSASAASGGASASGAASAAGAISVSAAPSRVVVSEEMCAGYHIRIVSRPDGLLEEAPVDPPPGITVTAPDGRTVSSWTGYWPDDMATTLWCRDVTGDGVPDLAYNAGGSGAHCCWTVVVVALGAAPAEVLRVDLLDAGTVVPTQLDRTPALELVADDYRLEGIGGLPFVLTSPLPRVFALRDGAYVDAPTSFPGLFRADRAKAMTILRTCGEDGPYATDCRRALGLRIQGDDLLLGAPTSAISRLPIDRATRLWLLAHRREVGASIGATGPAPHPQTFGLYPGTETAGQTEFVDGRATSGLPVTVTTTTPEVCTWKVAGDGYSAIITYVKPGACTVHLAVAGNAYWQPAAATYTITVKDAPAG